MINVKGNIQFSSIKAVQFKENEQQSSEALIGCIQMTSDTEFIHIHTVESVISFKKLARKFRHMTCLYHFIFFASTLSV